MEIKKNNYKPNIDGLRAIAVIAVVLFHTDIKQFSGGYIGVDIFFVISGYLITCIIKNKINSNEFSLVDFYRKRVIRLFPALFFVYLIILIFGLFVYDPKSFRNLGASIVSSSLFVSNILFYKFTNYFNGSSINHPLIHTWSLSVEEQFYIFFPLFFIITKKLKNSKIKLLILLIFATSLIISILEVKYSLAAAYYLVTSRIWELLFGSIIALNFIPKIQNVIIKNIVSLFSLIAIFYCIIFYNKNTNFPGLNALMPVLGTGFIIHCEINKEQFNVLPFLKNKVLVYIGKISYPLYLWNWPIVSFYKYFKVVPLNFFDKFLIIFSSFLLSILTWKFIEIPFKRILNNIISTKKIIIGSILLISFFSILGYFVFINNGFPFRLSKKEVTIIENSNSEEYWEFQIKYESDILANNYNFSLLEKTINDTPKYIFLGDSHVRALMPMILKVSQENNINGRIFSMSSTPPLLGFSIQSSKSENINENLYNNKLITYISKNKSLKYVFLHARWAAYINGAWLDKNEDQFMPIYYDEVKEHKILSNDEAFKTGLTRTIDTLLKLNKRVIIVSSIPEIIYDVPSAYVKSCRFPKIFNIEEIKPTRLEFQERQKEVNAIFNQISNKYKIQVIDLSPLFFDTNNVGIISIGDSLLYRDGNHLSKFGSFYLKDKFENLFKKIINN